MIAVVQTNYKRGADLNRKYDPEKMIAKSRFRDYYAAWEPNDKLHLIIRMSQLLEENSEYADNKNYEHMCNLITALAMEEVLEESGKSRKEAQETVANAMYDFLKPMVPKMQKLASHGWFVRAMKIIMPLKFGKTLGHGWEIDFPKCPGDTYSMITRRCIYRDIFSRYGMPEFTAVFCQVDDMMYSALPRAEFLYTQQIGRGGTMCDYTFKKR